MKRIFIAILTLFTIAAISISFTSKAPATYQQIYLASIENLRSELGALQAILLDPKSNDPGIRIAIERSRKKLKAADFWLRYLAPIQYKKLNGPLPAEWETEVFEKFEKPYKREGAGLTLAEQYLDEKNIRKDSLVRLIGSSLNTMDIFKADTVTANLQTADHFFLCNRLFLLNLAAIYTTGFECPDKAKIIPELRAMLAEVNKIYGAFNQSFPDTPLPDNFLALHEKTVTFAAGQSSNYEQFDHFTFIQEYVNPLFKINQDLIGRYKVSTKSYVDYSLNNNCNSIFNKTLYRGQNPAGIFLRVKEADALAEIEKVGKLLFYDPILSGNNTRSCQSCHNSSAYFTDTAVATSLQFNRKDRLPRNAPTLVNSVFNHLLMVDGKHTTLQKQTKAVITNSLELGSDEKEVVRKVLSCSEYKKVFKFLLKYTPEEKEINFDHIISAVTFYYGKFSNYYSPFDEAMNQKKRPEVSVQQGFNVFMGKAQCGTCHFVPQFNGVKPPFISSEFEVLGVPEDTAFKKLSDDKGRHDVNPAKEMLHAFRTGSIRNAEHTMPYMHNGVFKTLDQVIDFYDAGGGTGKGLTVENQTLSPDSLHLTAAEKDHLKAFIRSLNENIIFESPPEKLPVSKIKALNTRKVGGEY